MKKIFEKKNRLRFIFLLVPLIGCLFYSSCTEDQEGCLDILATNYDVTADVNCCLDDGTDCCCSYPSLIISIQRRGLQGSDASFSFDSLQTVEADSSHFFKINDIRFYLSDVQLVRSDGQGIGITDSVNISFINPQGNLEQVTVEDNVSLIKRSNFTYTIGSFEGALESYDSLRFVVGISDPMNHVLIDSLPSSHILASTGEDSLYMSPTEGFIFNKISFQKDTISTTDPTTLNISELTSISLPFDNPLFIEPGFNGTINLRINYLEWFKGINFVGETNEAIQNHILQNTVNVFEIAD